MESSSRCARLSVAPMMDYTDRHCRFLHRLVAPHALLYTEMVVADALVKGGRLDLLKFNSEEHPVALQLGGSSPKTLGAAARFAEAAGFDEVNLNVGCPSDRVQSGRFGACLMAEPALVADSVAQMKTQSVLPITVKTRIGIDSQDSFDFLYEFAESVVNAGASKLIVHARKAWLSGLSPKQNREIPPLDYDRVRKLAEVLPGIPVVINGGISRRSQALALLDEFDGIMLGRQAYHEPLLLAELDSECYRGCVPKMEEIIQAYEQYVGRSLAGGAKLRALLRPLFGLFYGKPGGRRWRRRLDRIASEGWQDGVLESLVCPYKQRLVS